MAQFFNWQTWQRWVCVWWHWGQGAELARAERTQPLIITDSKQLVLFRPIPPPRSDEERVHFGMRRDGQGDEKERRDGQKLSSLF